MNTPQFNVSEKKPRLPVLLYGAITLPAAVLFAYASDLPYIILLTLLILAVSLTFPRSFKYSDRTLIYTGITALILAVGGDMILKMNPERMGLISGLLQANISTPFLIYLAAMMTFFRPGAESAGACISMSLAANLLGGEIINYKFINKNMTFMINNVRDNTHLFFGMLLVIQILFALWALNISRPRIQKSEKPFIPLKILATFIALSIMPFLCWGVFKVYMRYENNLKQYELYFLKMGMKKKDASTRMIFDKNINLNMPLPDNADGKFDMIVLRAVSEKPPGYLRGRAYASYSKGEWTDPDEEKSEQLTATHNSGALSFSTFHIDETKKQAKYLASIYPCGNSLSSIIPAPGASSAVDIIAEKMGISPDGALIPESWQKDGGYTCKLAAYTQDSAYGKPENPFIPKYMDVPDTVKNEAGRAMHNALQGKAPSKLKDSEIINLATSYLLDNYRYSLKSGGARNADPVAFFLARSKKGHCELFASALVIMLRTQNIPARYVTGIICDEQHPSGLYYAARLGNAHAWVEAYPRDLNRWIMAEPTPPSGIPAGHKKWGTVDTWTDLFSQIWQKTFADMRRGYFAQAIIGTFVSIFTLAITFMANPLRALIIISIISILAFFYIRRRNRKNRKATKANSSVSMIMKEFKKFEKEVSRISRIRRKPAMPLGEWAMMQPPELNAVEAVTQYHSLRFRQTAPEPSDAHDFRTYIQEKTTAIRKNGK